MASAVEVVHSDSDVVNAVLAADLTGVVAKGSIPQVEIDLPDSVEAPVQKGQVLGTARLLSGGVVVAESSLLAAEDVARDDFPARWQMYWHNWLGIPQNRVEASD